MAVGKSLSLLITLSSLKTTKKKREKKEKEKLEEGEKKKNLTYYLGGGGTKFIVVKASRLCMFSLMMKAAWKQGRSWGREVKGRGLHAAKERS